MSQSHDAPTAKTPAKADFGADFLLLHNQHSSHPCESGSLQMPGYARRGGRSDLHKLCRSESGSSRHAANLESSTNTSALQRIERVRSKQALAKATLSSINASTAPDYLTISPTPRLASRSEGGRGHPKSQDRPTPRVDVFLQTTGPDRATLWA